MVSSISMANACIILYDALRMGQALFLKFGYVDTSSLHDIIAVASRSKSPAIRKKIHVYQYVK